MRYSDADLQAFLPTEDPPADETPPAVVDELDRLRSDETHSGSPGILIRRSTVWTYAAFEQYRLGNYIWEDLDAADWTERQPVAFGLFDEEFEEKGTDSFSPPFHPGACGSPAASERSASRN